MTYVIAQPCVDLKDKACIEECPVDCIYEGERSLYIHPDECVDCGACEPVCPVEAIYYEDDVPEQWKDYYKANVEFFDDLGSPGGAAKLGLIPKDHPLISALPPQEHGALSGTPSRPDGAAARRRLALPDFPWDRLAPYAATARAHPGGIVDLSVGTPVDPTPAVVRAALEAASDAPGLPADLRDAGPARGRGGLVRPAPRRARTSTPTACSRRSAPRSWSPGCRPCSASGRATSSSTPRSPTPPTTSAPGWPARRRCRPTAPPSSARGRGRVRLVWVNSPSNPTGRVLGVEHLAKVVAWARSAGAVVASDECYAELGWDGAEVPSILDPRVCGGRHEGLLAVYSRPSSPTSPATGRPSSRATRRWSAACSRSASTPGMIVPLARAGGAAGGAGRRRARRRAARAVPGAARRSSGGALDAAGFRIDHSEAGLYLWATRDEPCWETVARLADARRPRRAGRVLRGRAAPGTCGSR